MSSPLLWVILPLALALVLLAFSRQSPWTNLSGAGVALAVSLSAWLLPVGQTIPFLFWRFTISPAFEMFGRSLVINNGERGLVILIYGVAGLFFLAALAARPNRSFVPLGLCVTGLLVAAMVVRPFLYGAMFIVLAGLLSVPMLASPEDGWRNNLRLRPAILRFLTFQVLGMPFILFAGRLLERSAPVEVRADATILVTILIGFGFALLIGVFPFHTWIPMIAQNGHPLAASFMFYMFPGVVALFGLRFMNQFTWIALSSDVHGMLRAVGFIMVLVGSAWAIFQNNLGRVFGFAVLVELGCMMLAIGTRLPEGRILFFALFIPRAMVYIAIGLTFSLLKERIKGFEFIHLAGMGRRYPAYFLGALLALLAASGFPPMVVYATRFQLLTILAQLNPLFAWAILSGGAALTFITLRAASLAFGGAASGAVDHSDGAVGTAVGDVRMFKMQSFLAVSLGALLILFGLFPAWYAGWLERVVLAFPQLLR